MVSGTATGYLIAGFAASTVLVFLMLRVGRALNLMAVPNARSSHVVPTPTAGGLGFVIPLLVFFGMLYLDGVDVALGLLLSLVLVAAASLWDDFAELSAGLRFTCQTAAVALIVWQLDLPWAWYLLGLTGLALLWHVNLFNFMAGIDGIAAGQCLLYVVGVQVLTLGAPGWMGELCWLTAGAMLGFLAYNWPPAKIFMGDVGSAVLGLLLALLALLLARDGVLPLIASLILLAGFWFDATYTLCVRMATGQAFTQAHRSHLYQKLAAFKGHLWTTGVFIAFGLFWLLPLAWLTLRVADLAWVWLVAAVVPIGVASMRFGAGLPAQDEG